MDSSIVLFSIYISYHVLLFYNTPTLLESIFVDFILSYMKFCMVVISRDGKACQKESCKGKLEPCAGLGARLSPVKRNINRDRIHL